LLIYLLDSRNPLNNEKVINVEYANRKYICKLRNIAYANRKYICKSKENNQSE